LSKGRIENVAFLLLMPDYTPLIVRRLQRFS